MGKSSSKSRKSSVKSKSKSVKSVKRSTTPKRSVSSKFSKTTLVNFVLDETGSMQSIKEATINGFNEYVKSLSSQKAKVLFTLTKFNSDRVDVVCTAKDVKHVAPLSNENYQPSATTPLYDAIARTIKSVETHLGSKKMPVLCVIMTDGEENASKEFNREKIFKLIESKKNAGWTFVYLGANQDAWSVGSQMGISGGNTLSYSGTSRGTSAAFGSLAVNTACYAASNYSQTTDFFNGKNDVTTDPIDLKASAKDKQPTSN